MKRDDIILYLRRFKEINQQQYNIIRIGLFGSAARDNIRDQSDMGAALLRRYESRMKTDSYTFY
jgi:predicted nucleotidyltransferase